MRPKGPQPRCIRWCSGVLERHIRSQRHPVVVSELIAVIDTPNRVTGSRLQLTERRFNVKESVALLIFVRIVVAPVSNFRGSLSSVSVPNAVIDSESLGVFDAKAFEIKARDEMVTPRLVHLRSSFHAAPSIRQHGCRGENLLAATDSAVFRREHDGDASVVGMSTYTAPGLLLPKPV